MFESLKLAGLVDMSADNLVHKWQTLEEVAKLGMFLYGQRARNESLCVLEGVQIGRCFDRRALNTSHSLGIWKCVEREKAG